MRRPHSDHFDRTIKMTEGIRNTRFSRAVDPEKHNLKPRFASDDSFRFHGVKVRQLSLQSGRRSGHSVRCSPYCFLEYGQFEIDQAISSGGAEPRGERNDDTVQRTRLTESSDYEPVRQIPNSAV